MLFDGLCLLEDQFLVSTKKGKEMEMPQLLATVEIPQLRSWKHKNLRKREMGTIKTKYEQRNKIRAHQILQKNQA